jgi:hypothetical protein
MIQLILDHGVSGWFWHQLGTKPRRLGPEKNNLAQLRALIDYRPGPGGPGSTDP